MNQLETGLSITFRKADFEKDAAMLHKWHHEPHVIPYWNQDYPFSQYTKHLKKLLADDHQTLWIGHLNGEAMSYWETYWASADIIGDYYASEPYDQGVHLLIGDPFYLGKGLSLPMLREIMKQMFTDERTQRIVAEPDSRNKKMIHVFKKCGFFPQKEIQLPDKKALFMICEREDFEWGLKNDL
ncbi:GNAT family N-acetyltransferase [Bacillus sp. V2I10]|uniref:GNAT family N-acetyltransferase n=1 Tax=Bacillus sp. V2I10 TaxID=3042276 RepID=UPI00278028B5|nr:GNAT family N-acetyltransferase [Bacillus sp. V2I10]MDQ0859248.1 acetyl CoA:N6-hydroxylysine acetyl transferase [Bacillus sp. V2I10]